MSLLISYEDFSKLSLTQFYPRRTKFFRQERGFECQLGYSGCQGLAFTYTAWPVDQPKEVGEIALDFRKEYNECPPKIAAKILDALKLPIRPGMSKAEIVSVLGKAGRLQKFRPEVLVAEFECFGASKAGVYQVQCGIDRDFGLSSLCIVRKYLREGLPCASVRKRR